MGGRTGICYMGIYISNLEKATGASPRRTAGSALPLGHLSRRGLLHPHYLVAVQKTQGVEGQLDLWCRRG